MSFLNSFQFHFHDKQIKSFLHDKKYLDVLAHINNISNKNIYFDLCLKYMPNVIKEIDYENLEHKIVWINSFSKKDSFYLIKFLEFYLSNFPGFDHNINSYQEEISNIFSRPQTLDFNSLVNHSYAYQWMITQRKKIKYKFLFNTWPFFSSQNEYNFTNSNLTQSYLLLVDDPYEVFKRIKMDSKDDIIVSRNKFLNLDNNVDEEKIQDINFKIKNEGWVTHTSSWLDANVVNSLRGKIVNYKNLSNETFDTLSSVILHLIQSGVELEINYQLIDNFIKSNPINFQQAGELSKKEMKFLNNYVENIMNEYEF